MAGAPRFGRHLPDPSSSTQTAYGAPQVVSVGEPAQWVDLPSETRQMLSSLRDGELLIPNTTKAGTAGIALRHPEGVLVVWIDLAEQRPFTLEDQTLLTVLAGRLGQGLQRVYQVDQQRETALALQHAILGPAHLPGGFAVRYQAASRPLQVGGDWYDVVDLEDGRIALVVGDCVGHGLAAATVMGQVRSACRALLLGDPSPGAALAGMDRFAARLPGAQCTTAVCAVLNPDTGELVYSSAGHPPPILVYADGTTQNLDDGHTIALGIRPDWSRPEAHLIMPARATLVLYTDGLVERRRTALDARHLPVAALVQDGRASTLNDLANQIMSRLAPSGGYQDDVALLLYRHPAPLELKFPAHASHLAPTRTALRSWLTQAQVDPDQTMNVLIAAGEAVANAIEHGHRHSPEGIISLGATVLVDQVQLTITDTGSWEPPQPAKESPSRPGYHPHARAHARGQHQLRHRRDHSSPIREDHLMPTSLTLDTARRNDDKLVLIAVGEIDLSNIDAFNQALTAAAYRGRQQRRNAHCRPQRNRVPGQRRHQRLIRPRRPNPSHRPPPADARPHHQRPN